MMDLSRRRFVGASVGGATVLCIPPAVAGACEDYVTGAGLAQPPSGRLTVDNASIRNLAVFRQNPDELGLAGVVSIEPVSGRLGEFPSGNMFLFPWVKRAGQGRAWPAAAPVSLTQFEAARPIPDATLPLDEYYLHFVLQAPLASFIGFQVDKAYVGDDARRDWFSNVDKLGIGIDWTSHNLNNAWFGGSNWIPSSYAYNGQPWRQRIVDALRQASSGIS